MSNCPHCALLEDEARMLKSKIGELLAAIAMKDLGIALAIEILHAKLTLATVEQQGAPEGVKPS